MKNHSLGLSVYLAHRSSLVDFASPIVGCRSRAEDIVQDAYLCFSAVTEPDAADRRTIAHPVGYLYRTVRNLALNCVRRQALEGPPSDPDLLATLASASPTPEHEAISREQLQTVANALAQLPERTRRAFELHRLGGHTLPQVASILGISVGLAHHLVRDAITHCADSLNDDG